MVTENEVRRMFAAMDHAEDQKISHAWTEYDYAAEWCAKRGLTGKDGDQLPTNLSTLALQFINQSPESFMDRVRDTAYALNREHAESCPDPDCGLKPCSCL